VEFIFENYNVVLFALDVDVIDPEKKERSRKVILDASLLYSSSSYKFAQIRKFKQ
jgi:hypothetical protein